MVKSAGASPAKPSPAKASASGALHPAVQRLPQPQLTGNATADSDTKAKHALLLTMVDGMLNDQRLILPVYEKFQSQKDALDSELMAGATSEEKFDKISVVAKLEEGFVMQFLVAHSPYTCNDILKSIRFDPEAHLQLLEYETQLNPLLKLPSECIVKDISRRLLHHQASVNSHPLRDLKGAIGANGAIDWRLGCYRLKFEGEALKTVTFRNGDVVDVTEHITRDYAMVMNWSDWRAALRKPPFPDLKLHLLFASAKTGPYTMPKPFSGRSKEYQSLVLSLHKAWEADKQKAGMGTKDEVVAKEARAQLDIAHKEKKSEQLKRAREKAAETLQRKRSKQVISFKA